MGVIGSCVIRCRRVVANLRFRSPSLPKSAGLPEIVTHDPTRGQAHTLEAVVAALLLLAGLVFALQTTAVTPLSASTASQHIENQQQTQAEGVLAIAADQGTLKPAVLFWNESADGFHNASRDYYVNGGPPTRFGALLNRTFADRGIAFNVFVSYQRADGSRKRVRMVFAGAPSDNAVRATRVVALYDGDHLYDPSSTGKYAVRDPATTVDTTDDFYAPDTTPGSGGLYNLVRVEVVVWRM